MSERAASTSDGAAVVDYVRWVMVRKRDADARRAAGAVVPELPEAVAADELGARPARPRSARAYDVALAGSPHRWGDYAVGEKIDHVDGVTVEEAEHQIADAPVPEQRQGPFQPVQRRRKAGSDGG